MANKKNLILLFLLLFFVQILPAQNMNADSLIQSMSSLTQQKQAKKLPEISLLLLQSDTSGGLMLARQYLSLNTKWASNKQKTTFSKQLAAFFEQHGDFKRALQFYKLADSLKSAPQNTNTKPKVNITENNKKQWPFFLFILFTIAGISVIIFILLWKRKQSKQFLDLQNIHKELEKEILLSENQIEEKANAETGNIQKQLAALQQKEIELKTALKKAEEASYLRNAFIANLGFDVRTPLNGIIGFANMLETELAVRENQELYDYASNIEESGSRLLKLMNNVIDLSSLEANTLELKIKAISLEDILKKIYNQFLDMAREKEIIFKSKIDEDLHPALADAEGLEKAIFQIVDNAVRYTDQGFVTISTLYDTEKDIDIVEIKDTGPGIDKTKQKLLFEIIQSDDIENIKYSQGTGIGLKLAKKLTDLMQGRLELTSTPGKGTSVRLIIPCSDQAVITSTEVSETETIEEKEISTAAELGELDIFVVEDDRMNRLILEKMLVKLGKVKLAVDGDDCMQIIDHEAQKGHFYQIMLFDINLPGDWDGVKLMKEIRKKYSEYQHIPFIAQTAYAMAGDKDRFLKEGFDSYLSKPIDRNELISTIKQQLSIRQKQ